MSPMRRARAEEAALLSSLALRSKAHWGYDDAFMAACREELSLSADEVVALTTYVREVDGRVVGFYALEQLDAARAELDLLFVEPAYIGQGHGRDLIEHAKRVARELGARTLVIQGDPHAEPFYLAAGGRHVCDRASESIPGRVLPVFEIRLNERPHAPSLYASGVRPVHRLKAR